MLFIIKWKYFMIIQKLPVLVYTHPPNSPTPQFPNSTTPPIRLITTSFLINNILKIMNHFTFLFH